MLCTSRYFIAGFSSLLSRLRCRASAKRRGWNVNFSSHALQHQIQQEERHFVQELQNLCQQEKLDLAIQLMCTMQDVIPSHAHLTLLRLCSKFKSLNYVKSVHIHLVQHGLMSFSPLGDYLVEALVACGDFDNAFRVFLTLPDRIVVSWNSIMMYYMEHDRFHEIIRLFDSMVRDNVGPDEFTYVMALKACGGMLSLKNGQKTHVHAREHGCCSNVFVGSTLISMYGKCGNITEAENVFYELPNHNIVTWNAMLSAYVEQSDAENALQLYRQMHEEGVSPYDRTFVIVLQACSILADNEKATFISDCMCKIKSLEIGHALHADALKKKCASGIFIGSALLSMYGKCGSVPEAEHVLERLRNPNLVSWNVLLSAYLQHKKAKKALHLYLKMRENNVKPDELTLIAVVQACGMLAEKEETATINGHSVKKSSLEIVKALHTESLQSGFSTDIILGSTFMIAYSKCGSIVDPEILFRSLFNRDIVTWNAMLSVYVDQSEEQKALCLFRQMQVEGIGADERTFVIALQACCIAAEKEAADGNLIKETSLVCGEAIHASAMKKGFMSDMYLGNTLVSMYCKCGSISKAENVFVGMCKHDIVSWCAMLTAYAEGKPDKALQLFTQMYLHGIVWDQMSCIIALQACRSLAVEEEAVFYDGRLIKPISLTIGQTINAYVEDKGFTSDVLIMSTLVSMYGKCGAIKEAECIFSISSHIHDVVSWNVMLSTYVEQGCSDKALDLYTQMLDMSVILDDVTLICALQACCESENEYICTQLHFTIVSSRNVSLLLGNTLTHAHRSCTSTENAKAVFSGLYQNDIVSWTACITGHTREGNFSSSFHMFSEMHMTEIIPDEIAFLSLISACSHAGLVSEGTNCFEAMTRIFGISPNVKHYAGMVDLLGRAGSFTRMENLLGRMPTQSDLTIWLSLLAVCRMHGNSEMANYAFDRIIDIQPMEGIAYVMMSNICADSVYNE